MQTLEAGKPGAWTGKILALVIEWQLAHPTGTKDECDAWLRDEKAAGRIELTSLAGGKPPAEGKRARGEGGAATGKKVKK